MVANKRANINTGKREVTKNVFTIYCKDKKDCFWDKAVLAVWS